MKKLNKLFAILIAVLGVSATAKADTSILKESDGWQKITALPSNLGDYYYVFVDNGQDLMMTLGAGAHQGGEFKTMYYQNSSNPATDLNKVWTLETNTAKGNVSIRNVAYDHLCLQTEWNAAWHFRTHDNGGTATGVNVSWTGFTLAYASGKWSIQNGNYPDSGYLGPWDNSIVAGAEVACNKTGNAVGYFQVYAISKADFNDFYVASNSTEGQEIKVDLSFNIGNPTIEGRGIFWASTTGCGCNYTTNKQDGTTGGFLENWSASGPVGKIYQTITGLPNGVYELKMKAFRSNNLSGGDAVYVFANSDQTQVTTDNATTYYTVKTTLTSGTLELGLRQDKAGSQWIGLDEVSLTYLGVDLSELTAVVQATYDELNGLSKEAVPTAFSDKMTTLLNKYKTLPNTEEGLNSANNELKQLITDYSIVSNAYTTLQSFISTCEDVITNSEEFEDGAKTTFSKAVSTAKSDVEAKTTAEAINTIYNTLENARLSYIQKAEPTNGALFDYTFMVINPKFDEGTTGWTHNTGAPNWGIATNQGGAITGKFFENWKWESYTGEIYQELTGLPSGKYVLTVAAFRDQLITDAADGDAVYVFANDAEILVNAATPAFYSVEVSISTGTLRFGVKSKVAKYRWMGIDNASLSYKGFDIETAKSGITSLINQSKELDTKPMDKDVRTVLNQTIDDAEELLAVAYPTRKESNAMMDDLNKAMDNANASIAEYNTIAAYIAKADGINESIASDYKTQHANGTISESLETVFQNLEVATYNYVKSNFTYSVALSDTWNSTGTNTSAADVKGEHWSDNKEYTYKNQFDGWGDPKQGYPAGSWTIDFDQEVKLPAGEYVFKVAGRKSVDATLKLVVTMGETELGTVNDFPSSNEALGINKAGATSFDANDPAGFAKEGKGYGWQWRYVRFVLDEEATVKVAVHAETNKIYNWVSFGDYTLQMTEETYLKANMGGLDAPTAAAEALVDTKPMGTAENNALKAAIALPVETGAQLLAKIDALNTAVANANAWIPKYNEAKAPLVAALERFETDYNDAENGALDYMNKNRWAAVIEKAQAAAEAKDVTDSYEGFATVTENLVAALDAATVSVGEYADLKKAIDEATPYLGGDDWGSEPFQKPESAKDDFNATKTTAQNAYDAAEVDGEDVTAVIGSLKTAINDVVLNAPAEGQRFYIKVATEGHDKKGNAILATLGSTGENNPTGYGLNTDSVAKGYLAQAFIFTQVEENLYNISIERPEGTVYLTYGLLNGSAAGWNKQQIQATTDADKKGDFKIVPTGKNGILKIFNTVDNNYIDCQAGGAIYTDTGISNEEFAFELASEHEVTLNISTAGWATLILPFNAGIPDGVTVYASESVEGELVKLKEVGSIVANTPYLISGTKDEYTFSGYGLADEDSYMDANGFVGTYVDYETTGGEYVLQNHKGKVAFYRVGDSGESAKPTVKAYRCYLTASANEAKAFFFDNEATGINGVDTADAEIEAIYTINGTRVNNLQKGLNIVKMSNGKTQKVYVK